MAEEAEVTEEIEAEIEEDETPLTETVTEEAPSEETKEETAAAPSSVSEIDDDAVALAAPDKHTSGLPIAIAVVAGLGVISAAAVTFIKFRAKVK